MFLILLQKSVSENTCRRLACEVLAPSKKSWYTGKYKGEWN